MQELLRGEAVASDGEDLLRPLGIYRNNQADVSDDEALLQPLNIGIWRSNRNAVQVGMQTTINVEPSEGVTAVAMEDSGAAGNHDRDTVRTEVEVTEVLHKLLNSPGKEIILFKTIFKRIFSL